MFKISRLLFVFSVILCSLSIAQDIPADCQNLGGDALFSLKVVAVNATSIAPANSIHARPGDILQAEIFVSCWGQTHVPLIDAYQSSLLMAQGAASGTFGTVLPLGWDAALEIDYPPCDDPAHLIISSEWGTCVGPDHDPDSGATIDTNRPDFILPGTPYVHVALDSLYLYKFGGALDAAVGIPDPGFIKYGGSLGLEVSPQSCGVFTIEFDPDVGYSWLAYVDQFLVILPRLEELTIHVCEDDGLYCNGLETCDAELGCQIVPPPNCDDGIDCTIDSCDEAAEGCVHALNHGACDDGKFCSGVETCTPAGCNAGQPPCDGPGQCDEEADECRAEIPTVSNWGLVILVFALLITAKLRYRHRPLRS